MGDSPFSEKEDDVGEVFPSENEWVVKVFSMVLREEHGMTERKTEL